jgi:hypothetical protein
MPSETQVLQPPVWQNPPGEEHLSSEEQDYLFDLRGFRVLKGVVRPDQLQRMNAYVDSHDLKALKPGDWVGDVEIHTYGSKDGINFQNIIEGGEVFEELITQSAWLDQVRRYIEVDDHWLALEENFLNVRESGGYIPIHSGGTLVRFTSNFRNPSGKWAVGQINVIMAMTDVGPGDGPTTLVPGSHKSQADHPQRAAAWSPDKQTSGGEALGMVQMTMQAGDALMFTDGLTHGSMPRTNPGQRRVLIYRYAPQLLANRFHYIPSRELINRLSPEARRMVLATPPRFRPGRAVMPDEFGESLNYKIY